MNEHLGSPPPVAVPWECMTATCINKGRWWRSTHGVVLCSNCQPPASPALVAAEGGPEDAPMVFLESSRTPFVEGHGAAPRDVEEAFVMGRPAWILLADRTPQKVEARGNKKKFEIPPDATHWCCEGDVQWTRIVKRMTDETAKAS